jgi:hypothetical protein
MGPTICLKLIKWLNNYCYIDNVTPYLTIELSILDDLVPYMVIQLFHNIDSNMNY